MEITLLFKFFIGLLLLLALLLYFLLFKRKKKSLSKKSTTSPQRKNTPSFEALISVIKNKNATREELFSAVEDILKYYGTIHPKLGMRSHPDFDKYGLIILKLCHHPHTDKKIILKFDKELRAKNPEYAHEINDFLTKGLDTRGV